MDTADNKPWWEKTGDWLKENWQGVALGAGILVAAAALTFLTGGAAAGVVPFLVNMGATALIGSAAVGVAGMSADALGYNDIAKVLYQGATIGAVGGAALVGVGVGGQVIAGAVAGAQAASAAGGSAVGGAMIGAQDGLRDAISNVNIGGWQPGNSSSELESLSRRDSNSPTSSDEFKEWLNKGKDNNSVYNGLNSGKEGIYTGMTRQELAKRLYQHQRNGKPLSDLEQVIGGLTKNQAHAIEQYLLENGSATALNIRNSISQSNPYYEDAMRWAKWFIETNNIQFL